MVVTGCTVRLGMWQMAVQMTPHAFIPSVLASKNGPSELSKWLGLGRRRIVHFCRLTLSGPSIGTMDASLACGSVELDVRRFVDFVFDP